MTRENFPTLELVRSTHDVDFYEILFNGVLVGRAIENTLILYATSRPRRLHSRSEINESVRIDVPPNLREG